MPPQPPELMEELVEEVLLRFRPDDPASLVRAALVCKLWCRLVSATAFRRRFREFHRSAGGGAAPLVGVIDTGNCKLIRHDDDDAPAGDTDASLKPIRAIHKTSRFVRAPDGRDWVAIDDRHGRVLLYKLYHPWQRHTIGFSVWDPVTDEQRHLPELPFPMWNDYYSVVVCAAAAAGGDCDHLDCHRGPFQVVFMYKLPCVMRLSVYASEAGEWSQLPDFKLPLPRSLGCFTGAPIILMGSTLYLLVHLHDQIIKYDLATRELSAIPLPSKIHRQKRSIQLIVDDDCEIGFVAKKLRL